MSFIHRLQELGFTVVTFDMARGVSINAWRGSHRKGHSVWFARDLDAAETALMAQLEGVPATVPVAQGPSSNLAAAPSNSPSPMEILLKGILE